MKIVTQREKKQLNLTDSDANLPHSGLESRIAAVADLYESRKQAATAAGVALSSLQRWIASQGTPAFDSLARLALGKGVSLDWIATGTGRMFVAEPEPQAQQADGTYAYIPLYDARISAGHGYGSWSKGARVLARLAFTCRSLHRKGLDPDCLSAVQIDGDSNEPILNDGDTVMLDHSRNAVEGEAFYVIRLEDHLYAKRLQKQVGGGLAVISANPVYQTMTVDKEHLTDLEIIGRVVWAGRWLI